MIYSFEPTQDLHGYDKPWAPGTSYNLIFQTYALSLSQSTVEGQSVMALGRITGTYAGSSVLFPCTEDTVYKKMYRSGYTGNRTVWAYYDHIPDPGDYTTFYASASTYTAPADGYMVLFYDTAEGVHFYDVMVCENSYDGGFLPYENSCPLEGYECIPGDPVYMVYAGYVDSQTGMLYMRPYYAEYDGEELVGPWMSSLDGYEEGEIPTTGAQVVDLGGDLQSVELNKFMLQTLLRSLGIVQNFGSRTLLLNSLIDQATGRVREDDDLLEGLHIHIIGDVLPGDLIIKPGKPVKLTKEDL